MYQYSILEGSKAELIWMVGYIPRWLVQRQSPIQVLTGPGVGQLTTRHDYRFRVLTHPEGKWLELGPMREEIHVDIGTVTVAGFTVTGLRLEKPVNT